MLRESGSCDGKARRYIHHRCCSERPDNWRRPVITFNEVIGDSRCPQNVNCIWEGVASSRVTIIRQGANYSMALNQPGSTDQAKQAFIDYTLTHSLNPYPIAGEEISPEDYRLTLTVTK